MPSSTLEAAMTTRETSEICELTGNQLDLVTGGSIAHDITTAVKLLGAAATIIMAGAVLLNTDAGYQPDPWA
jgi:hypothetical protein